MVALLATQGMERAHHNEQLAGVLVAAFGMPNTCRWTNPSQAAKSVPRQKVAPLPIAATSAIPFSTPMPGIVARRRAAHLSLRWDAIS